jgi:hypothetical protein
MDYSTGSRLFVHSRTLAAPCGFAAVLCAKQRGRAPVEPEHANPVSVGKQQQVRTLTLFLLSRFRKQQL